MNKLTMTRGDTGVFSFQRKDKDGKVIEEIADELYFTVKKSYNHDNYVIQKTINDMDFDNGKYTFTVEPSDTDKLDFGEYDYDLEVIQDTYKKTISLGKFEITKEVTYAINEV